MSLDFPSNPSINDEYSFGSKTWFWNGFAWELRDLIGPTGPTGPTGDTGATGPTGPIGPTGAAGVIPTNFVASLNGFTGSLGISAGTNITINQSGNTFTISSSGGGSGILFEEALRITFIGI